MTTLNFESLKSIAKVDLIQAREHICINIILYDLGPQQPSTKSSCSKISQ